MNNKLGLTNIVGGGGGGNTTYNDAYATPPAAPLEGDLWLPTDSFYTFRYNGAAWIPYKEGRVMTLPIDGDFAWINEVNVTKTVSGGAINLDFTNAGADSLRLRVKAAPATPYTVTVAFTHSGFGTNWSSFSFGWRQSADGKLVTFSYVPGRFGLGKYNAFNAFSGWYLDINGAYNSNINVIWARITDNGVNRIMSLSYDGIFFRTLHTVARNDFLVGDQVMWGGQGGGLASSVTLLSWAQA